DDAEARPVAETEGQHRRQRNVDQRKDKADAGGRGAVAAAAQQGGKEGTDPHDWGGAIPDIAEGERLVQRFSAPAHRGVERWTERPGERGEAEADRQAE